MRKRENGISKEMISVHEKVSGLNLTSNGKRKCEVEGEERSNRWLIFYWLWRPWQWYQIKVENSERCRYFVPKMTLGNWFFVTCADPTHEKGPMIPVMMIGDTQVIKKTTLQTNLFPLPYIPPPKMSNSYMTGGVSLYSVQDRKEMRCVWTEWINSIHNWNASAFAM